MARLTGKFAGILRVDVPDHQVAALKAELVELASAGLHIVIEPGDSDDLGETQSLRLELIGDDRPGIVRDISQALAERRVNIDELETESVDSFYWVE